MPNETQGIRQWLTRLGEWAAHPGAYGILVVYTVLWFVFDRASLDWHGVATLGVWFMTLLIQRTEHRDTQALQRSSTSYYTRIVEPTTPLQELTTRSPRTSCAIATRRGRRIKRPQVFPGPFPFLGS